MELPGSECVDNKCRICGKRAFSVTQVIKDHGNQLGILWHHFDETHIGWADILWKEDYGKIK